MGRFFLFIVAGAFLVASFFGKRSDAAFLVRKTHELGAEVQKEDKRESKEVIASLVMR